MRNTIGRRILAGTALAGTTALLAAGSAGAHGLQAHEFSAALQPVPHDTAVDNGSNVNGSASLDRTGRWVNVRLVATGLDALPHAMHIHGKDAGELAFCPGADRRDDITDDGLIETAEGLDDYGPVQVSLTTSGDTSADSILALPRFASGDAFGTLTYERRIKLPLAVARDLDEKHIVIHGEDLDNDGMYNGPNSALGVPLEAELPVACGEIVA
jgi:hypothetical protein